MKLSIERFVDSALELNIASRLIIFMFQLIHGQIPMLVHNYEPEKFTVVEKSLKS